MDVIASQLVSIVNLISPDNNSETIKSRHIYIVFTSYFQWGVSSF